MVNYAIKARVTKAKDKNGWLPFQTVVHVFLSSVKKSEIARRKRRGQGEKHERARSPNEQAQRSLLV